MPNQPPERTLMIERPIGLVILRASLLILIVWGLAEGLVRLSVATGLVRPPRIGSVNAELDTKLILLEKYIAQNGPVDCFFLGSSQFDEAVDPAVFEKQFRQAAGRDLRCFNFSLGTMTAAGDGVIARLLVGRYHPRILFIGLSARDFSDDFGELTRPLLDDPWIRYSLGEFTLSGWLTEHSAAYRALLTIRSALNPDYMTFHDRLEYQLTGQGYLVLHGSNLDNPKKNFIPSFKITSEDMAGLEQLRALDSDALRIVFVEVPVHHSFIQYYIQADPSAYESLFIHPVAEYFSEAGLTFWQTQDLMQVLVPDSGWVDVKHFNQDGATIFSAWLADRTSKAIEKGEISIPSD